MIETLKNLNALVVDDEADIREAYQETLEGFFARVYTACEGQEGLEICADKTVHAVFVDYEMPGMGGFEFVKALRQSDSRMAITVVSNHTSAKILQKFFPYKPCGYLFKPLRYRELKEHMAHLAKELSSQSAFVPVGPAHHISFMRLQLLHDGQIHTLTRLESDFIHLLYERRGRVASFGAILEAIDQEEFTINGIKNLVYRIRRKYGLDTIINIKGLGYKMEAFDAG